MSEKRVAVNVGIFMVVGLVLIGVLLLSFSKGMSLGRKTYDVSLTVPSVGGLRERSAVFLSGVQVGNVRSLRLAEDGRSAIIELRLYEGFSIYKDAQFVIEQMGLLGDQFVTIHPTRNKGPILQDGDTVTGLEPFNLQEVARSATDLMKRFDTLSVEVKDAVTRLNNQLLDSQTLSNASLTVANLRLASERVRTLMDRADQLIATNEAPVGAAMSNFVAFTTQLRSVTLQLEDAIRTNRSELTSATRSLAAAAASIEHLTGDVEAGRGTVGALFRDEHFRGRLSNTVNNAEALTANLVVLSSNLSTYGIFYKPRAPRTPEEIKVLQNYPGKSPFKP